jgi:hypothetical protein
MNLGALDLTPDMMVRLGGVAGVVVLLLLLLASFMSRARVFCQYLEHMTGIRLSPARVRRLYSTRGRSGVRDALIDLLIREDLADSDRPVVTPDSKPDLSVFDSEPLP